MQRSWLQQPLSSATLRRRKRVFGFTASQLPSSAFQKTETLRSKQQRWHRSSPSSMNIKSWSRHIEATHPKKHKTPSPGFSRFKQRALMSNLRMHSHCRTCSTDTIISHIYDSFWPVEQINLHHTMNRSGK